MPIHIKKPTQIKACGNKPKIILEYIGRVNSQTDDISIAHMKSPMGWVEPGQTPEFAEYTVVIKGSLKVKSKGKTVTVKKGEAIIAHPGEWIQYSTPAKGGAEYIAVCLPAFSMDTVHRDS
jgi:mannose-6-phosphate isomerase-like protein (cupin superfamily)